MLLTPPLRVWKCEMNGAPGTVYASESFELRIEFSDSYGIIPYESTCMLNLAASLAKI